MEDLASLGIFLGGVDFFLLSAGLFWFVSEWSEIAKAKGTKTT